MFYFFKKASISTKFTLINSLVVTFSLVIICISFLVVEEINSKKKLREDLALQVSLISYHVEPALIFNDKKSATETLRSLKTLKSIKFAAILDYENKEIFASYYDDSLKNRKDFSVLTSEVLSKTPERKNIILLSGNMFYIKNKMTVSDDKPGWLYLAGTMDDYYAYRNYISIIILFVFFLGLSISFFGILKVQRVLSKPIFMLSDAMRKVRDDNNYSVQVMKYSEDEIGILTDVFNEMIKKIIGREQALKSHQEKLEVEVSKRTNQLIKTNYELELTILNLTDAKHMVSLSEETKRVAEESLKVKSQFFANMSHELRTPLNGVLGMLSLMRDTSLTEEQENFSTVAFNSGYALLSILNDILDLSKIESEKFELEKIEFNVEDAINDCLILLGESCYKKNVELVFVYEPKTAIKVLGDPTRFKQIIYNLVGNAIKFTAEGYVKVVLDAKFYGENKVSILCDVEDTGIGIKAEYIPIIFNKFSQADSSTTRQYGGTGLGLSLSRELVSIMGGEINLRSEFGKGSVFSFSVQFDLIQVVNNDYFELADVKNILILEKNQISIEVINKIIYKNIAINSSLNFIDFYEKIKEKKDVDLIVIDISTLESFGVELSKVYGLIKDSSIPMVYTGDLSDKNKFLMLGMIDRHFFIEKPFKRADVIKVIGRILDKTEDKKEKLSSVISQSNLFFHGKKILIAEDNKVNQQVVVGRLSKLGIECYIVENGVEAIAILTKEKFDLIFMDCQMPIMDGYAATKEIVSLGKAGVIQIIPIIAMTANAMKGDKEKCLEAGMNDYLSKPFSRENLHEVLSKWLVA